MPPSRQFLPIPRALHYSLIHLIERLLDQAGNLSKGRRGKPAAIWLSMPLVLLNSVDNSISALRARLGFCIRRRDRWRKWGEKGEEGMRLETGRELRLFGPRADLGQTCSRLSWQEWPHSGKKAAEPEWARLEGGTAWLRMQLVRKSGDVMLGNFSSAASQRPGEAQAALS